jgi:hypothetical protein
MHPARSQDRNRVKVFSGKKGIDIVVGGHAESGRYHIGARSDRVTNRDKFGLLDMTATQQFRMTLCNTPTPEQAKSDHQRFLVKFPDLAVTFRLLQNRNIDQSSISMEVAGGQADCRIG